MKLGRFTSPGVERFNQFLDELKNNPSAEFPHDLLSFPGYFETIDDETEIMPYKFKTRWDVAKYLNSLVNSSGLTDVERDAPFWVALTAYYFDVLCPADKAGERKVLKRARYVPETQNWRRYYRHLLLGPYLVYRAHLDNPERAIAFLCKPPHVFTDVDEQILAYQEFVTNKAVVELTTRLYYNPKTKDLKYGAQAKGPGSPRRLVTILDQFSLTWDLYSASAEEIMALLPNEFGKFAKSDG
ncbi:MAG: hypothetical protein HFACDABA_03220 [Anaerolineales bacterium]|nr:hypothetical protein [Anaerolineales bacterium]